MKKCTSHFIKIDNELLHEFKEFIIRVNQYLSSQVKDTRYHASNTKGQSKIKHLTIEDDKWRLTCEQNRENAPFTDRVVIYYLNQKIWTMSREGGLTPAAESFKVNLQRFFYKIAENYDSKRPWSGPRKMVDDETDLIYESTYSGSDEAFTIYERCYYGCCGGSVLWHAKCSGGFI